MALCKVSSLKLMASCVTIACGSIHQGVESFSVESRGPQCMFMSLASLIFHHAAVPLSAWNSHMVDQVFVDGGLMYLKALADKSIPDEETLSANYLPVTVRLDSEVGFANSNKKTLIFLVLNSKFKLCSSSVRI